MSELTVKFNLCEEEGLTVSIAGEETLANYVDEIMNDPTKANDVLNGVGEESSAFLLAVVTSALLYVDGIMQDNFEQGVLQ